MRSQKRFTFVSDIASVGFHGVCDSIPGTHIDSVIQRQTAERVCLSDRVFLGCLRQSNSHHDIRANISQACLQAHSMGYVRFSQRTLLPAGGSVATSLEKQKTKTILKS